MQQACVIGLIMTWVIDQIADVCINFSSKNTWNTGPVVITWANISNKMQQNPVKD